MGASELLAQLANPATVKTLPFADKMLASLLVTFLGMGITFLALIILQLVIDLLARFTNRPDQLPAAESAPLSAPTPLPAAMPTAKPAADTSPATDDDDELLAVISAVLAMSAGRTAEGIVIRNVRRIDSAPAWGRAGIVDQMNSRF